jgi:uncharacterized protein (DUF2062 family)
LAYRPGLVSDPPQTDGLEPRRTAWQRQVIDPIAAQLTQGITPEKIALTLAVGSALALFPIIGTTTLLCIAAGILLRLNQPIIQLVNALCTPIHLPAIFLLVRFGARLFNAHDTHMGFVNMNHMLWDDPREFLERFGETALHAVAAWAVVAPFWMIITYLLSLPVLREALRRRAVAETARTPPPEHPVP